jgi:hypothetical protein
MMATLTFEHWRQGEKVVDVLPVRGGLSNVYSDLDGRRYLVGFEGTVFTCGNADRHHTTPVEIGTKGWVTNA